MHKEHNVLDDSVLFLCELCEIIVFFVYKEAFDTASLLLLYPPIVPLNWDVLKLRQNDDRLYRLGAYLHFYRTVFQ